MERRDHEPRDARGRPGNGRTPINRRRPRRRYRTLRGGPPVAGDEAVAARCRRLETVVTRAFRLPASALRRASRGHAEIAFARQVAMYVAHVWFALSFSEVGRCFERDRTTVAHACRVVEDRREDPGIDRVITAIESAAELWEEFVAEIEREQSA